MKRQSVGILLCALLLTTFGHDVLQRHQVAHSARLAHHGQAKHHHLLSRNHQTSNNEKCHIVCEPIEDNGNLTISVDTNASLVAVYNASAHIAIAIDLNASLVGIFNLTTSGGVIIDLNSQSAVEVTGLWKIDVSFSAALTVLSSGGLQVLAAKGEKVSITKIAVLVQLALVVVSSGEYHVSVEESVGVLIAVFKSLEISFKSVLVVVQSGEFSAKLSLKKLVERVGGLSSVISHIQGGIEVIKQHNISFSLEIVLTVKSSFEIVGYFLEELSRDDLLGVLGDLTNSTNVIKFIASLGGNSTEGVNGLVTVLVEVLAVVHDQGSVERIVGVLIEYFSSNDHSIKTEWEAAINGLYEQIVKLKLQEKLKSVLELLVKIRENKWVEANINISGIIIVLVSVKDDGRLNGIAVVLVHLGPKISVEEAIVILVFHFIALLAVRGGVQIIVFLTKIRADDKYLADDTTALVEILRGISIRDVINAGFGGFFRFLQRLTIIGDLIVSINVSFKAAGASQTVEGSFSFGAAHQVVVQIQRIIVGVIKGTFHISGSLIHHTQVVAENSTAGGQVVENSSSSSGNESQGSGSTSGNWSISGGAGESGGAGGNSSGSAGSAGNNGDVSGGEDGSNSVTVGGNKGGNVGQEDGDKGAKNNEDDRHKGKGKHAKHRKH